MKVKQTERTEAVWDSIPGLGPKKFTHSIFTPPDAEAAYVGLAESAAGS